MRFFRTVSTDFSMQENYLSKNYRWIIGTMVAIIIPILIYSLERSDSLPVETKTFYYADLNGTSESLLEANCWTGSLSSGRTDAYRCMVDSSIYDPCFEDSVDLSSVVSCPRKPYEKKTQRFKMKSKPEDNNDTFLRPDKNVPWYIILSDKRECRFITGATGRIADHRIDYECGDGESLLLPVQEKKGILQIGCTNQERIEICQIMEAWY